MSKSPNDRRIDYIEFRVHDISKTKAFYRSVFGWCGPRRERDAAVGMRPL